MSSLQPIDLGKPLGGRYKVISQLGAGGFGKTFLAEDMHLPGNPQCVIKQLKPQVSDAESLQTARRLFDTEAQVLYKLGNHDQIPRLLAHFEDSEEFYLAQELIRGEQLTKELVKGQLWPETGVIAMLEDILRVLAFVHEQQVIHRDLKPPNLIRRKHDERIVLIDFGAVKQASQPIDPDTGQTNLTVSIGTQGYVPNEQLAGKPRFSSDVYAVGLIAIQALTGLHPKHLGDDSLGELSWREKAKHVSPELADILDCMVRYDFRSRYPSAVEALQAVQSLHSEPTESMPLLKYAPETPSHTTQAETSFSPPSHSNGNETTESEKEPSSTNLWLPKESPDKTQLATDMTETELASTPHPSLQTTEISASTTSPSGLNQKKFVAVGLIVAVLGALGAAFLITKTVISSQTAKVEEVPVESPTTSPTPLEPKQQVPELMSQADRLQEAQQYQEAIATYDKLIGFASEQSATEFKSEIATAYLGRCYSLNQLQKPAEATVACNDALDLKPDYPEAIWGKAKALDLQEQPLEALWLYEKATKLKPDFAEAWVDYGAALQGFGRSVEAIRALDKGIALKRDSVKAWSIKGEALVNLGRFDEGIASLDKALQIQPDNPEALKLRQKAREQIGR
ncbi:protein kinase domain-containing protein [Lyngbya aestuarii]|uniref:protein kinase domain-containing protein n=1 Tax=Lyngbya aestuarii TaxID=118322 RepID=UPI00403D71DD